MKYIHHDTNAADDEKLGELIIEHGYEGYGLFWAVLEKIGKQEKPIKTAVLKKQLKVGKKLEKCWSFMESIGLIYSSNGETFNKQLLTYAGKYKIKKEKNAERISQWRERQQDAENVTHSEQSCNTPNRIEVKRSKENRIETLSPAVAEVDVLQHELEERLEQINMLTQALEEERKKVAPKKKETTPHWKELVAEWTRFYASGHNGNAPTFGDTAGSALKSIMARIKFRVSEQQVTPLEGWTAAVAVQCLRDFLTRAWQDPWHKTHFSLQNLSSKFDELVNNHEQSNSKNRATAGGLNADYKRKLAEQLAQSSGQSGHAPT